jgi:hypothetical protein
MKGYKQVLANRLDVIIKKKTDKTWSAADVASPSERKVQQKEEENKLKYVQKLSESLKLCHTSNQWGHWNWN